VVNIGRWSSYEGGQLDRFYCILNISNLRAHRFYSFVFRFVVVGKHDGKRPLGRPMRRWGDNITMDLLEVGLGGLDWIDLAQDRD
jgi:hypothetical protein